MKYRLIVLVCFFIPFLLAGCNIGHVTAPQEKSPALFSTRSVTAEPASPEDIAAFAEEIPSMSIEPHPDAEMLRNLELKENEVVSPAAIRAGLSGEAFFDAVCFWPGGLTEEYEGERIFNCADGTQAVTTFLHRVGIGPVVNYEDCLYAETQMLQGTLFFIIPFSEDCDVYSHIPTKPFGIPNMNYDLFVPVFSGETQHSNRELLELLGEPIPLLGMPKLTAKFKLDTCGINTSRVRNEWIYGASPDCPPAVILDRPFYYGMYKDHELVYFGRFDFPENK